MIRVNTFAKSGVRKLVSVVAGFSLCHFAPAQSSTPLPFQIVPTYGFINADGDTLADEILRHPGWHPTELAYGRVVLLQSPARNPIGVIVGREGGDLFGIAATTIGDLNGDGIDELLVGAPGAGLKSDVGPPRGYPGDVELARPIGRVVLCSGATGETLATFASPGDDLFGFGIARVSDADADFIDDFMVLSLERDPAAPDTRSRGVYRVISTQTGQVLFVGAAASLPVALGAAWTPRLWNAHSPAAIPLKLGADLNADGFVTIEDLGEQLANFGQYGDAMGRGDLDGSQDIQGPDLTLMLLSLNAAVSPSETVAAQPSQFAPCRVNPTSNCYTCIAGQGCQNDGEGTVPAPGSTDPGGGGGGGQPPGCTNCPPPQCPPPCPETCPPDCRPDCSQVSIRLDENNDGLVNAGDNATPLVPVLGKIMAVNFDDDNGDLLPDVNNFGTQWEDNDLVPMHISWNGPGPAAGVPPTTSFTFIYPEPLDAGPGGKIIVWSDRKKTTRYASGQYYPTIPQNMYRPPSTVYVEGVATGPFTVSMYLAGHGFVCGSTSDQTYGFIAELKAYDLRSWTVQRNDAEQRLEITPLRPSTAPSTAPPRLHPDSLANPTRVDGSATDGAAAVVMHLASERPPASSMGEAFQIPPELKLVVTTLGSSNADDTPDRAGALFPSAPPFAELPMPIVPLTPAWSATLAGWGYDTFLYVPPDHCHAIPPDKQDIQIDVQLRTVVGDRVLCSWAYRLTRPPLVLCHGLWSSPATWPVSQWSMTPTEPEWPAMRAPIYKVDYEASNAAGFDVNWQSIPDEIDAAVRDYREGWAPHSGGRHYALCRVDFLGHSMGGVLGRLYASELEASPLFRKIGHVAAEVVRSDYTRYANRGNNHAGAFRRFITLGSPLKGCPLAPVAERAEKAKKLPRNVGAALLRASSVGTRLGVRVVKAQARKYTVPSNPFLWPPVPDEVAHERAQQDAAMVAEFEAAVNGWLVGFPNALIDLAPNSALQTAIDAARFPTEPRRVRWHPIVGVAPTISPATLPVFRENARGWLVQQVANGGWTLARSFDFGFDDAFDALVGDQAGGGSDLMVPATSQRNENQVDIGTQFSEMVHSTSMHQMFGLPLTTEAEPSSPRAATRVIELLYGPPDASLWTGDLSR